MTRSLTILELLEASRDTFIKDKPEPEERNCVHFGCPVKLSRPQALFGDRCPNHQGKKIDIMSVLSFPVKFKK